MFAARKIVMTAAAIATTVLTGCGSSATKPSESAFVQRLSADQQAIQDAKSGLGTPASSDTQAVDAVVNCTAQAIWQYGTASSLSQYMAGKITYDKIQTAASTSKIENQAKSCTEAALGSTSSSTG